MLTDLSYVFEVIESIFTSYQTIACDSVLEVTCLIVAHLRTKSCISFLLLPTLLLLITSLLLFTSIATALASIGSLALTPLTRRQGKWQRWALSQQPRSQVCLLGSAAMCVHGRCWHTHQQLGLKGAPHILVHE